MIEHRDGGPTGFEPVGAIAAREGVTPRCMKRRLTRLQERLQRDHPTEPPLVVKFGTGPNHERWYVDRSVAWRHARGLVGGGGPDPWKSVLERIEELHEKQGEQLARIEDNLSALSAMAARRRRPRGDGGGA